VIHTTNLQEAFNFLDVFTAVEQRKKTKKEAEENKKLEKERMMSMQLPKNMANEMRAQIEREKKDKAQRGIISRFWHKDKKDEKKTEEVKTAMKNSKQTPS
jgi:hypothetical protein